MAHVASRQSFGDRSSDRASCMVRILVSLLVILHGLVHLLYFGQSARLFELQPGMGWPDGSWAVFQAAWREGDPAVGQCRLRSGSHGIRARGRGHPDGSVMGERRGGGLGRVLRDGLRRVLGWEAEGFGPAGSDRRADRCGTPGRGPGPSARDINHRIWPMPARVPASASRGEDRLYAAPPQCPRSVRIAASRNGRAARE